MSKDRQHGRHGVKPVQRRLLEQQQVPNKLGVPRQKSRGLAGEYDVRRERGEHRLEQQQRWDDQEPDGLGPVGLEDGRSLWILLLLLYCCVVVVSSVGVKE